MSVKNYRPISLLCNVSKILEGLIYDRVISTVADSIIHVNLDFREILQLNNNFSSTFTSL